MREEGSTKQVKTAAVNAGYLMPTNVNFGEDSIPKLAKLISCRRPKKVLIFTGAGSAKASGALDQVKNILSGRKVLIYSGIKPNPSIESLKDGIEVCRKEDPDFIISIGGGSVIDYGKAISVLSKEKAGLYDFFHNGKELGQEKVFFTAIPTTFGTSSEITPYAVMTDQKQQFKITLTGPSMFPEYAFIDPKFTISMARPLVATSCADLFSHVVEAYWNVNATGVSDDFSIKAIELFLKNYQQTYEKPQDISVRRKIGLASIYAGLAFSNTKTTACHSISYPMTVIFGIPHGIACILTLGEMLEFNSQTSRDKILELCKHMGCATVKQARDKISLILSSMDIKAQLRDYGLTKDDLRVIVDKGFTKDRMANNPRPIQKDDLKEILERVY